MKSKYTQFSLEDAINKQAALSALMVDHIIRNHAGESIEFKHSLEAGLSALEYETRCELNEAYQASLRDAK